MIQAVIFDFGGVVVTDIYLPWVGDRMPGLSPDARARFLLTEDRAVRGLTTKEEYFRIFDETFGQGSLESLDDQVPKVHASPDQGVLEIISKLKLRQKIGLLSNNFSFWAEEARKQDYMRLFDAVVFSCEVGMAKPEGGIYILIAEKLGVPINGCLFVDNLQVNVDGAEKMGMLAIRFEGKESLERELLTRKVFGA